MGTYYSVTCRSRQARDKMLAFLAEHFTPGGEMFPTLNPRYVFMREPPQLGKDICAYAKRKNDIGYYVSAGWDCEERGYKASLHRWIALKVGKTMTTKDEEIPGHGPLELSYVCSEHEPHPIVLRSQYPDVPDPWEEGEVYEWCDDLGWDRSMRGPVPGEDPAWDAECREHLNEIRERKTLADPIVQAELSRLDALWSELELG